MTNILMIEDDLELAEITAEYLEKFDMKVDIAHEPYIGLSKLALKEYQLIILDLSLPGLDGLEVCKEIRKSMIRLLLFQAQDMILQIRLML